MKSYSKILICSAFVTMSACSVNPPETPPVLGGLCENAEYILIDGMPCVGELCSFENVKKYRHCPAEFPICETKENDMEFCRAICAEGKIFCHKTCIDPYTNAEFCGADKNCADYISCAPGQICQKGICKDKGDNAEECAPDEIFLNGVCIKKDDPCAKCADDEVCEKDICVKKVSSSLAPSYAGLPPDALWDHMGATVIDGGIQFIAYSENAARIELLIFDDPEADAPKKRIPLMRHENSPLWSIFEPGLGAETYYGYIAWGPNWPYDPNFTPGSSLGFISDCDKNGNRFNPNKLLIDPYTRRIHRDFDWNRGNPASGTARSISTWGAAPKSVVIQSEYKWSAGESKWRENRMNNAGGHDFSDAVIYEAHPKGFTAGDKTVSAPGTWRGIGEKAPYLKDLGITALELMPVAEKNDDGTYWGYDTIAFFAPEQRFAVKNEKMNAVTDEFKWMVDQLHQNGIEIIIDVVYNHTGEGGFWHSRPQSSNMDYGKYSDFHDKTAALIYSWRGLDNASYYHLADDGLNTNAEYFDTTGKGNQLRTDTPHVRRFILDNLRYWVDEMHVDGFRFDLASVLGVPDDHPGIDLKDWFNSVQKSVLQDIADDELLRKYNTRIIAEPWHLSIYGLGGFPKSLYKTGYGWSEWNGRFRDMMRRLVNSDSYPMNSTDSIPPAWEQKLDVGNILTGSSVLFGDDGRKPYNSVNFITAHDGFTMYDLVTYQNKENGCGKLNPVCCSDAGGTSCDSSSGDDNNNSRSWCRQGEDNGFDAGGDGKCRDKAKEALKRQMIRNFFALMMISHGTPMILGGDEYMRTQFGNNNAYSDGADNEYNWFRWDEWTKISANVRMHDFVRKMIGLRKQFAEHLAPKDYNDNFSWRGPDENPDNFWNSGSLAMLYPSETPGKSLFVMINMNVSLDRKFTLPPGSWNLLVDTLSYYDTDAFIASNRYDKNKSYNITNEHFDKNARHTGAYTTKPRTVVIFAK